MYIFLFFLLFMPHLAQADDIEKALSITEKECRKLMRTYDTSGAEYVPGVDVQGQPVTGADLNGGSPIKIPEEITFPLGIDLGERHNLGPGLYGKTTLGEVKVKGHDIYWNGEKLQQNDTDAALEACRAQYGQK